MKKRSLLLSVLILSPTPVAAQSGGTLAPAPTQFVVGMRGATDIGEVLEGRAIVLYAIPETKTYLVEPHAGEAGTLPGVLRSYPSVRYVEPNFVVGLPEVRGCSVAALPTAQP